MDAFYASVEQRDHPEYRGKAIAVGRDESRGVVSTASYEARKYGVRSAMPSTRARELCPNLIFVPGRMAVYKEISAQIHEIFREYTNIIEPLSIDEAFLDVTHNKKNIELASDIAREIKEKIKVRTQLTASAGISFNKFLAKIASDYRKPDGLYVIHPQKALDFIAKLPIESFWGVGKVTAQKMHKLGIHNGLQLRQCSLEYLTRQFGKAGQLYFDFSHGIDNRTVNPERERKSAGCERTYEKDLTEKMSVIIELYHIAVELSERLKKSEFKGNTLTLKIRFSDFSTLSKSITIGQAFTSLEEILPHAKNLLKETHYENRPIRLLGLSVSHPLSDERFPRQLRIPF